VTFGVHWHSFYSGPRHVVALWSRCLSARRISADSISWPLRLLDKVVDAKEGRIDVIAEVLARHEPGYERDLWISPKELCDMVEKYEAVVGVGLSEHGSDRSENALRVRLFPRDHSEDPPIELEGLYMFKSRYAVTQFLQSFMSTPKYADAIPDLAGIIGMALRGSQPTIGEGHAGVVYGGAAAVDVQGQAQSLRGQRRLAAQ